MMMKFKSPKKLKMKIQVMMNDEEKKKSVNIYFTSLPLRKTP